MTTFAERLKNAMEQANMSQSALSEQAGASKAATKPFRFCKARFTLTETGKIKVNGSRDGVKRARRKLKLFHREFKEGKRTFFDIEQYMECQSAYYRNFNDHGRLLRLRRLYHAIFFGGGQCLESSKPGPVSA